MPDLSILGLQHFLVAMGFLIFWLKLDTGLIHLLPCRFIISLSPKASLFYLMDLKGFTDEAYGEVEAWFDVVGRRENGS